MRPASASNQAENGLSVFNGVLNSPKRPERVENGHRTRPPILL